MDSLIATDGPAPYTSPSAVIALIRGYRERGLQVPFTPDVLVRAGIAESLVPRTLSSLKLLGLTEDAGQPTPRFVELRKARDDYQEQLASLVRDAYAEVFSYVDPAKDPEERVRDAFRSYTPVGQQGRMVTLFLGLCAFAGIVPDREVRAPAKRGVRTRSTATGSRAGKPTRRTAISPPLRERPSERSDSEHGYDRGNDNSPQVDPMVQGLIRQLPATGSKWPRSKRADWLRAQEAIFALLYPADDEE